MKENINEKRRNFLKGIIGISLISTIGGIASVGNYLFSSPSITKQEYPRVKIANVKDLEKIKDEDDGIGIKGKAILFCYPLTGETNLLIKVGEEVVNGIGKDKDIIAFSSICQHLGCKVNYYKELRPQFTKKNIKYEHVLWCPCHQGIYDVKNNAEVLEPPPPRRVPRVILEIDEKQDIYAVGMEGPVITGRGPPGLKGINLPDNLKTSFFGGEIVNEETIITCGRKTKK